MSDGNGHIPEGAVIATLEMLRQANTKQVVARSASARLGAPMIVRIRSIRKARYLAMLPPRPPQAEAWPADPDEYGQHYAEWLKSLSHAERIDKLAADDVVIFKVLAEGLIDPPYSDDVAAALAEDADEIAVEILRFSEILKPAKKDDAAAKVVA